MATDQQKEAYRLAYQDLSIARESYDKMIEEMYDGNTFEMAHIDRTAKLLMDKHASFVAAGKLVTSWK